MADIMVGKDRDEQSGQYEDTYPDDEFFAVIQKHGGAADTREIAEGVGCHRDTARRRLNTLADKEILDRRDVGDSALWILLEPEENRE